MKKSIRLLGIIALAAVISFSMTVCGNGDDGNGGGDGGGGGGTTTSTQTPLTGTVTVTNNITTDYTGKETMKLTADISGLNGIYSSNYSYQWIRDGVNISGATKSTYDVTETDYGKTVRVKITYYNYSGEQFGDFTVPSPTICRVSVKYDSSTPSAGRTKVIFEKDLGTYSTSWESTSTILGITAQTVTLTSWNINKFKMRIDYTFIESKYYFKKDNESGSESFDLTNGTKSYVLKFNYATSPFTIYYDLFAIEE